MDTNILLYAANRAAPESDRCAELLQAWADRQAPWYLTWGICYEFLRLVTHPNILQSPRSALEAWGFIEELMQNGGLGVLVPGENHNETLARIIQEIPHLAGNIFHDAETAALMRENGVRRIYTRDTDFHRFPFLEVIDPLTQKI